MPYLSASEVMVHEEALYQVTYLSLYLYRYRHRLSVTCNAVSCCADTAKGRLNTDLREQLQQPGAEARRRSVYVPGTAPSQFVTTTATLFVMITRALCSGLRKLTTN